MMRALAYPLGGAIGGVLALAVRKLWAWSKKQSESPTVESFTDWQRRVRGY
jgi:hypothetical protein